MIPRVADIKTAVCAEFGVRPNDLMSHRVGRDIARPRQAAMYLTRELTPLSLGEIGRLFDRDHSTVSHAIRIVERIMRTDRRFAAAVADLRQRWEE